MCVFVIIYCRVWDTVQKEEEEEEEDNRNLTNRTRIGLHCPLTAKKNHVVAFQTVQ